MCKRNIKTFKGNGIHVENHFHFTWSSLQQECDKSAMYHLLVIHLSSHTEALKEVAEIATQLQSSLIRLENFQKLTELQRDLIGIENLTAPGRVGAVAQSEVQEISAYNLTRLSFFIFYFFYRSSFERGACTSSPKRGYSRGCFSWLVKNKIYFHLTSKASNHCQHLIFAFMSFQFSDMLLYTSKGVTATNQFKVHGQLPLHGMIVSLQSLLLTSAILF